MKPGWEDIPVDSDKGFCRDIRSPRLPRGSIPHSNELVCVCYRHPSYGDKPYWVWSMRRRLVTNWTRSLEKQGFKLSGVVRIKR